MVEKSSRKQCILLSIEFFLAWRATYHFYCLNQLALERSLKKGMHVGVCMRWFTASSSLNIKIDPDGLIKDRDDVLNTDLINIPTPSRSKVPMTFTSVHHF